MGVQDIHFNFNLERKYDIVLAWLLSEELIIQCNLELKNTKYLNKISFPAYTRKSK